MDMSQYRGLFFSETREHLHTFNEMIVCLEADSTDRENIDSLFRTAHSIKGMAASMGFDTIAELAHNIEDLMDKVRKNLFPFDQTIADLLLEGGDLLDGLVNDEEAGITGKRDFRQFTARLADYTPQQQKQSPALAPVEKAKSEKKEKGGTQKREERLVARQTVRVRTDVLDNLINFTGELITNKHRLMNIARTAGHHALDNALEELSRLLRGLHNEVLNVRMMPLSSISDQFPRIIRDLARKANKEVAFEVVGKEIEVDRGILEELADPLVHILRNAMDHGLETPSERVSCGKDPLGKIQLTATREKDQLVITIEDDGKGMDPAKLIASAVAKGIITLDAAKTMSSGQALLLTCRPGFSTAPEVTDVSGRGVGMDVVSSTIQTLGGRMTIESEAGRGTAITLKLPLTIAIINVLLIQCAQATFAVPVSSIVRTMEIRHAEVLSRGQHQVFQLDDEAIPLLSMTRIFGFTSSPHRGNTIPVLVSEVRGRKVALVVDRLLGHQEVFVKPLGKPLGRMKGLIGGAIIGNGEVVFILDIANIV